MSYIDQCGEHRPAKLLWTSQRQCPMYEKQEEMEGRQCCESNKVTGNVILRSMSSQSPIYSDKSSMHSNDIVHSTHTNYQTHLKSTPHTSKPTHGCPITLQLLALLKQRIDSLPSNTKEASDDHHMKCVRLDFKIQNWVCESCTASDSRRKWQKKWDGIR